MSHRVWSLGDSIAWLRRDRGWNQQDLADHAGIGKRTVIRMEVTGGAQSDRTSIQAVAAAFGMSEAELLRYRPPFADPAQTSNGTADSMASHEIAETEDTWMHDGFVMRQLALLPPDRRDYWVRKIVGDVEAFLAEKRGLKHE